MPWRGSRYYSSIVLPLPQVTKAVRIAVVSCVLASIKEKTYTVANQLRGRDKMTITPSAQRKRTPLLMVVECC